MKKISFSRTELQVAPLCLGTVNYGSALPEKDAIRQLDEYVSLGGNFIDTAHIYGDWQPGDGPLSEITIGKWLKGRNDRQSLVISTKGAHPRMQVMEIPRCGNQDIQKDLDDSLSKLNTDYVDLYFLHRDDPRRPAGEIVEFLEEKAREGKIRYYGCSNWKLSRLQEANEYARSHGLHGFVCNQLMWSLAEINFDGLADKSFILMDKPTYRYHAETGLNVMAYMSVAKGYFPRRYQGETLPSSVTDVYQNSANDQIYRLLSKACESSDCTITDYTLRYFMEGHPFPAVPIASFDNSQQLREGMRSIDAGVDPEVMAQVTACKSF